MNKMTKNLTVASKRGLRRWPLLLIGVALLVASGCENNAPEPATAQAPANAVPSAGAASDENLNADRYDLGGPKKAIKVGEKSEIALTIEAADGLEINEEFPWSITIEDCEDVEIAQKEFKMEELKLETRRASIPLTVSALAPGTHTINAVGNFSVCNDTQCYVIRNQKLAFNVEASGDKDEDAPPASAN